MPNEPQKVGGVPPAVIRMGRLFPPAHERRFLAWEMKFGMARCGLTHD